MRLLLQRSYTPRGSLGRLLKGGRQLCFIREAPKACYDPSCYCMEEGVYLLEPVHSEKHGWSIQVGGIGRICSKDGAKSPGLYEFCPVTCFRADGTPLFTRLAFLKLMDELTPYWESGELIELQIVSKGIPYQLESCLARTYC